MLRNRRSQSSLCCLDLLDQLRHDLEQIAHDAVIGHTKDGCALILVDSDDALRILHTGGVLDSTRDTQSYQDLTYNNNYILPLLYLSYKLKNGTLLWFLISVWKYSKSLCT